MASESSESLSMCATRSRRSSSDAHRDHDRNHQHPAVQASHLAPHPFYLPPPYARYPPYDPYAAYHCPGLFYPPPPCHVQRDVAKEETAIWSWPVILFLIFLVTVLIWIVYRNFSRENRRKLAAWLRLRRFQPQTARTGTKQDAAHNVNRSAEFHRCTEDRGESTSPTDTTITRAFVNPDYEEDDDDDRYGSENEERKQDAIFMRPGSIHRILTNLKV